MPHLVLLGDSIFDNGAYVRGHPAVIDQVRQQLTSGWQATLLAVDGNVTADISRQLQRLPLEATHLVVSVGGNDALGASGVLHQTVSTVADALSLLHEIAKDFQRDYHEMLQRVMQCGKPAFVCTIYDSIPNLAVAERAALALFNDVILREAFAAGVPVVDLRMVCTQVSDYSSVSPIEPSHLGGANIAGALVSAARQHDFSSRRSVVYA